MAKLEEMIAFQHAPLLLQKVHLKHFRADMISKVNFAGAWADVHDNWRAAWRKDGNKFKWPLKAHGYYSLVETHTHRLLLYAFYHPQDYAPIWGSPEKSRASKPDQHLHDMEGCLAVVPKRKKRDQEYVEALLTISHYHFYSYGGWVDSKNKEIKRDFRVGGWEEDVDDPIQVTARYAGEDGEPGYRFKLFADPGSHAIKGFRKNWGNEREIIRYRPSLTKGDEPTADAFQKEKDVSVQDNRYKLVSMFGPQGLWPQRDNPLVFQMKENGQVSFVLRTGGKFKTGSANPPWGWDDKDDRNKVGEIAWDPAHLVANYFNGLREFSREYTHNPYLGIIDPKLV